MIKKIIGEDRWNNIDRFINENPELSFDEVIYDMLNMHKFDRWYNEKIKHQNVEILGIWRTDYGDIACNAILYKDEIPVANIIESYEEATLKCIFSDTDSELYDKLIDISLESFINEDFEKYLKLPKVSECSKLLQEIYDQVCESDSSMCHVDDIDWMNWKECYNFKDEDIEILKEEIMKYNLGEIIGIGDDGYKIVGYGNLQFAFNDDRNLKTRKVDYRYENKNIDNENEVVLE